MSEVPYSELDPPIVGLVRVLNDLPGIETLGSCAGHEDGVDGGTRSPANQWWVSFALEPADRNALIAVPSDDAWISFEFLSWAINRWLSGAGKDIYLLAKSPPPAANYPGRSIQFAIEAWRDDEGGIEPDDVAREITAAIADETYVPAELVAEFNDAAEREDQKP